MAATYPPGPGISMTEQFRSAFEEAIDLHQRGDVKAAEGALVKLRETGENRELVLQALLELYLQARQPLEAMETLLTNQNQSAKLG